MEIKLTYRTPTFNHQAKESKKGIEVEKMSDDFGDASEMSYQMESRAERRRKRKENKKKKVKKKTKKRTKSK